MIWIVNLAPAMWIFSSYSEFDFMEKDPDLENLRKDRRFYILIEKYTQEAQ